MIAPGEFINVVDSYDQAEYWYGGEDFMITDEDIELLKAGKIINFSVNSEYGCTLAYMNEKERKQWLRHD